MDSLDPEMPPVITIPAERKPRVWQFWGTALWGLFVFAAMILGQLAVVGWLVLRQGWPVSINDAMIKAVTAASGGSALAWSVIMGLPAVVAAVWLPVYLSRTPFTDYLALRLTSWKNLLIGIVLMIVVVMGWDMISRLTGRDVQPGFMGDVVKSAEQDGALWLLVIALCVAAPITEEFFARGFLYRGWSESFLRVPGAILLSSLVWTSLHLQYDLFFLGEVFSIGLVLGYMRYRSQSIWLTILLHGLNNLAALAQTLLLAN
jgi:membrane protease YdiL (CAAX protease family)